MSRNEIKCALTEEQKLVLSFGDSFLFVKKKKELEK
jgi:hypothetical protein